MKNEQRWEMNYNGKFAGYLYGTMHIPLNVDVQHLHSMIDVCDRTYIEADIMGLAPMIRAMGDTQIPLKGLGITKEHKNMLAGISMFTCMKKLSETFAHEEGELNIPDAVIYKRGMQSGKLHFAETNEDHFVAAKAAIGPNGVSDMQAAIIAACNNNLMRSMKESYYNGTISAPAEECPDSMEDRNMVQADAVFKNIKADITGFYGFGIFHFNAHDKTVIDILRKKGVVIKPLHDIPNIFNGQ